MRADEHALAAVGRARFDDHLVDAVEHLLERVAAEIRAAPADWIAQETVFFSTHPTVIGGALAPRHVDLRAFVAFDGVRASAIPGGLSRVAFEAGNLVVNSSQGGGAKDTWVMA